MASIEQISGGRLVAGLGLGGWSDDFAASRVSQTGKAALWESTLTTMRQVWSGKMTGQGGPMLELPGKRPAILFGGLVPAAYQRAASQGQGWVAPLFGLSVLQEGAAAVRQAWSEAGRTGQPRIATGRYFGLGEGADAIADEYIRHYYLDEYFPYARADTVTTSEHLRAELQALQATGVTDVILYPTSGGLEQVGLLAEALKDTGFVSPQASPDAASNREAGSNGIGV
jgi:alkanesulfonate monooxygenase SsuD/methylene tetrahydromethanopterin reductase-like flavin-dependent oxidoreductase (luciferase family)